MRDDLLQHLFVEADVDAGKYTVKFFKEGKWINVTVDDLLPCGKGGKPIYGHCAEPNEIWVPLMEKAYAKLHGSYQALEGGSISEGLVDITGGAPEEIDLDDDDGKAMYQSGELWSRLLKYQSEQYLLGCAYICDGEAEVDTGSGLLQNHAYGIMCVVECHGHKLLKCRNPWGQKEWNGDWSDHSSLWTDALRRELGVEQMDDGVFWMSFDDFVRHMNRVYVARLYEDDVGEKWQHTVLRGTWSGESAAGCVNFPNWHLNPQWAIDVDQDTEVYVCLSQPDKRMATPDKRQYTMKLGFNLLRVDDSAFAVATHPTPESVVVSTTYLNVRELARDAVLKAGEHYVFVPSTFNQGVESPFVVELYSRKPIRVRPLGIRPVSKFPTEWAGKTAGGCINHPTWHNNPQVLVRVTDDPSDPSLTIAVAQQGEDLTYIGFLVVRSSHRLTAPPSKADVVLESAITNVARVAETAKSLPAGDYVIVASTFEPGVERRFSVEVSPQTRVAALEGAPVRSAAQARARWAGATAGGCPNHRTWRNNPQFLLTASAAAEVDVALVADRAVHVGWYAFAADGDHRRVMMTPDDIVARSQFVQTAAAGKLTVTPDQPLLILPCTFEAGVETDFTLSAFGDGMTLSALQGAHMVTLSSAWAGKSAGGCTNHETWKNNPRLKLVAQQSGSVQLLLTLPSGDATGIGILISRKADQPDRGDLVGESELLMGEELVANKPVWVMPTTFDANVERDFEITCYSTFKVEFG